MDSMQLDKEDKETLKLELINSANGRLRKIRTGILTVVIGLTSTLIFYTSDFGRLSAALTLISILAVVFGLFNIISWFLFSKSIEKLKKDFDNGTKLSNELRISGYNFLTKRIALDNGLKIDSFEIQEEWQKGDLIYIEYLPTSNFILKCGKNAR
jgi:hypothetical protein